MSDSRNKATQAGSIITTWIASSQRVSLEKARINAANKEAVARIWSEANMYCADVDERIARDTNRTVGIVAAAQVAVASTTMMAGMVRARCDQEIARIAERTGQFQMLAGQVLELQRSLVAPALSKEERGWIQEEIRQLRQEQRALRSEAEHEARRLPPLVAPRLLSAWEDGQQERAG